MEGKGAFEGNYRDPTKEYNYFLKEVDDPKEF